MKLFEIEEIEEIKNELLQGSIIAFGTDTVFGLACIYDDLKAIEKIYEAKGRDKLKALPMMCSNIEMIDKVAYINEIDKKIMNKFTPGPLTIIFKKKEIVDDYITSGRDTIGIRIPNDKWILDLIDSINKPLLVTSANISNEDNILKWKDVLEKMGERIDGLVKKDAIGKRASTIIDGSSDEIKILREGPISLKEIVDCIKE